MTAKTSTQRPWNKAWRVAKTRLEAMIACVLVDLHITVHLECVPVSLYNNITIYKKYSPRFISANFALIVRRANLRPGQIHMSWVIFILYRYCVWANSRPGDTVESVEGGNHVGQNNPVFIMTNKTVPYKRNIDGEVNLSSYCRTNKGIGIVNVQLYCVITSSYHNW